MTNQFSIISSAVLAKLQALTKFKYVYAYEKGVIEGYPAITIFNSEYSADWADTQNDLDKYVFTIHIYQEMDKKTPAEAEQIINDALVECFQSFQSDYTLGGKVDIMTIRATKGWVNRETTNRVAVITLSLQKLNSII
jgi:uncharacterized protein YdeI (YjbR/CyaY-like superfamily)